MKSTLTTANYFEGFPLEVVIGNDIAISILGELELFYNFVVEFNQL